MKQYLFCNWGVGILPIMEKCIARRWDYETITAIEDTALSVCTDSCSCTCIRYKFLHNIQNTLN